MKKLLLIVLIGLAGFYIFKKHLSGIDLGSMVAKPDESEPASAPSAVKPAAPAAPAPKPPEVAPKPPSVPPPAPPPTQAKRIEQARQRLEAARAACLARLERESADYRAARQELDELEARVRELRASGRNQAELAQTSPRWIEAKGRVQSLQSQALEADAQVQDAEQALKDLTDQPQPAP